MRKAIKTKDDVAKEKEQEMAKLKQDEFYAEPDELEKTILTMPAPDISEILDKKIPIQTEFQLIYDIASQLAAMTALKLDKVLIQTSVEMRLPSLDELFSSQEERDVRR